MFEIKGKSRHLQKESQSSRSTICCPLAFTTSISLHFCSGQWPQRPVRQVKRQPTLSSSSGHFWIAFGLT
jgi:hypothetical protein